MRLFGTCRITVSIWLCLDVKFSNVWRSWIKIFISKPSQIETLRYVSNVRTYIGISYRWMSVQMYLNVHVYIEKFYIWTKSNGNSTICTQCSYMFWDNLPRNECTDVLKRSCIHWKILHLNIVKWKLSTTLIYITASNFSQIFFLQNITLFTFDGTDPEKILMKPMASETMWQQNTVAKLLFELVYLHLYNHR